MGSCYICGAYVAPHEAYRRRVQTGNSLGFSFGKRVTPSVRTYFGLRTLCAGCAMALDKRARAEKVVWVVLTAVIVSIWILYSVDGEHLPSATGPDPYLPQSQLDAGAMLMPEAMPSAATAGVMQVSAPSDLNVRSGPGTAFGVVKTLRRGDIVTVDRTENGWSYIGSGWVNSRFLVAPDL
jgi:hypothetical protein